MHFLKLKMPGRIVVFQRFSGHFAYLSVKREIYLTMLSQPANIFNPFPSVANQPSLAYNMGKGLKLIQDIIQHAESSGGFYGY